MLSEKLTAALPRPCPPDRLPREGETIYSKHITSRSRPDYKIDTDTGCWVWQKSLDARGYPAGKGRPHRLYFTRANPGVNITGLDVHHECENTSCVNPAHLAVVHRVKHLRGHKRGVSRLTEPDVIEIRASRLTARELAVQFGVTESTIENIWAWREWKDLGIRSRPVRFCAFCGDRIPDERRRNARYCTTVCRERGQRAKHHKTSPDRWQKAA